MREFVPLSILLVSTPYSGALINLIDALWIFVGPKRQCLHDVIAETVVVDLGDPSGRASRRNGFLFSLGITLTLLTALVLFVSLVIPK
ncbi:hypothetical protein [Streptosporangium sp. OZ121]|uniref:hypothetical protein n=1 Tax=Streptosporangium sp. OZ121 TaxID=3444183 RepID=UPI003F78B1DA